MTYKVKNYSLLQELYDLLKSFPFDEKVTKRLNSMDLESLRKGYLPYSELENDSVANAICWCISTLQSLLNKYPVKALDEVLSFAEHILKEKMTLC